MTDERYVLRLYVTGRTPRSEMAVSNLRRIVERDLDGRYDLEIVDVLEDPERAEEDRVIATPSLLKLLPPPARRLIGDLSDTEKVVQGLDLGSHR